MFTGLIEVVGTVREVRIDRGGAVVAIAAAFPSGPVAPGESIAVAGPCLTVERLLPGGFEAFASGETLARTTLGRRRPGDPVNLERALPVGGRFGGHIVGGHVDGTGRVRRVTPRGEARELAVLATDDVRPFLAAKGSIAIDGVSLTVNGVRGSEFTVMIIPHTLGATTLDALVAGDEVNLEADVVARYVAALASRSAVPGSPAGRLRSMGLLEDE